MNHRLEYILFLLIRRVILWFPLRWVQHAGAWTGSLAYRIIGGRRRIALENLRHAFPDLTEKDRRAIALGSVRNSGIAIFELLWFPNLTDRKLRQLVRPVNPELIHRGHEQGKGMVMLSGHFGNWELIALAMARLTGHPFTIIVQTQSNTLVDREINRHRCLFGNTVVPMEHAVREMLRTLQRGDVVAIAPDQSGPMEGVFVDFFGRSVATHQGPAVFALKSKAVMQMGFIVRSRDGTYDVTLEEVPTADLNGPSEENVLELTRRHTALLEKYIRQHPDHWLWMHRRWKHTWESVRQEKILRGETIA